MAVIYTDTTNKYGTSLTAINATATANSFIDLLMYPFTLLERSLDSVNVLKWINEIVISRADSFADEMDYLLASDKASYDAEDAAGSKVVIVVVAVLMAALILMKR